MLRLPVICLLALGGLAATAQAREPTAHAPIVVGETAISRGALEDRTRQGRESALDREEARRFAAASLIGDAVLRNAARRRGIRVRGRDEPALEAALGRRVRGASTFVAQRTMLRR